MISDMYETGFKIPKTVTSVTCYTTRGERIEGDVFLDITGRVGRQQVIDFFCEDAPFFPIRTAQNEKPFLIARNEIVAVSIAGQGEGRGQASVIPEIPGLPLQMQKAVIDVHTHGSMCCEIFIDSPVERCRVLDVLNHTDRFLPVIWENSFSLININHILKVVEL